MNQPKSGLSQTYSAQELQVWLRQQIAEQLNVPPQQINVNQAFDSLGLNSAQAMLMIRKAEEILGYEVSPILLWHYPTIAALSQRLVEESEIADQDIFEI